MKNNKQILFITGFMGAGKSTFGRVLAKQLNYTFIDTDSFIEDKEGQSITQLVKNQGESHFRQLELKAIQHCVSLNKPLVVACGGGLPCFNGLHKTLKSQGLVIYLKAKPKLIVKRLKKDRSNRPLLAQTKDGYLKKEVKRLYEARKPFYKRNDLQLKSKQPIEDLIQEVLTFLNKTNT